MHSLEEIRAEYDRLDALCGVDSRGIELRISRRMTQRLGSFRYPGGDRGPQIAISALLLTEDEAFWDTVRHEYAHALLWLRHPRERHGHDEVWKAACREVGCAPKSRAPVSESQRACREERAKYILRCESCGQETSYLRAGKIVNLVQSGRSDRVRCRRCGGKCFSLRERAGHG